LSAENIQISQKNQVWATTRSNTTKLVSSFKSSDNVILLFSVNESRHFQGYAKMVSPPTKSMLPHIFGVDASMYLGFNFQVQWLSTQELSFQKVHNVVNPWNENLPIKISRDCQEVPMGIGNYICSLIKSCEPLVKEGKEETLFAKK